MTINGINGANTQMGQRREKQYSFDDMIGGNQKTGAARKGITRNYR